MLMKLFSPTIIFLVGALIFLIGCGILPTPTPTPTATPLPTNTPLPTATAPPTATRPKPTATRENALPPAIAFALNKTQSARSLNFDFSTAITSVQNGKETELPGLALKGQDSTLNRHVTVSGMTNDTNEFITYELIVLGDSVFIKGLTGVPGIDPALWYALPADLQSGVRSLPTARGLFASFDTQDFANAKFQKDNTETLDDQTCTVWSAQNADAIQKIIGVSDSASLKKQLGEIDQSELKLWTCADGYIHLVRGTVRGHNAQKPNDTVRINLYFQLNQFDNAFDIQAPPDAKPFVIQESPGTATPQSTNSPTGTKTTTPTTNAKPSPTP